MSKVTDLQAHRLAAKLHHPNSKGYVVEKVPASHQEAWRASARKAGRILGVHVRTGRSSHDPECVWVVNEDREVTEEETRAAVERVGRLIFSPGE